MWCLLSTGGVTEPVVEGVLPKTPEPSMDTNMGLLVASSIIQVVVADCHLVVYDL